MSGYANPNVLVTTDWVHEHLSNDSIRVIEVDVDTTLYGQGHIPGAVGWSWKTQLSDSVRRDVLSKGDFEALMSDAGIANGHTVVLYGDSNNWFAAWAFWQLAMYGHEDVRMMDGGRRKWVAEGRPLTADVPTYARTRYRAAPPDRSVRAMLPDVQKRLEDGSYDLVDVRSPAEFSGELLAPEGLPETCQRGGHIPGAASVPWSLAVNGDDGTFRSADELRSLYRDRGIGGNRPVITYCRIGERSSHTWFVLRHLLGFDTVKNYDGSWTEWGNLVGAPIETGL